ncbi:MAG: hypothetical protein V1733_09975 [bacterium]
MRLKKKIRRILDLVLWSLLFAGAGVLLGFADYEQNGTVCRNLFIKMNYGQADMLVTEAEIDSLILISSGKIVGKPLWAINTECIERSVSVQPYVSGVHVYETFSGDVIVHVSQRQPVLRVISESNYNVYIGDQGVLFPINPDYPARVLIASGTIPDSSFHNMPKGVEQMLIDSIGHSPVLADLFRIALFVSNDPFFKAQIDQIYVNRNGEYELIPKVGDHVILLGKADDLGDKFQRLFVFYRKGLNQVGWNKYNYINIKYKNQVVCSKI